MSDRWETIGKCGVDSGLLMLIDPGHVIPRHLWTAFLNLFRKNVIDNAADLNGIGVVVNTPHGDGVYPVMARYNKAGQIIEIRVDFD